LIGFKVNKPSVQGKKKEKHGIQYKERGWEGKGETRYSGMKGGRALKKHGKQGHLSTTSGMDWQHHKPTTEPTSWGEDVKCSVIRS